MKYFPSLLLFSFLIRILITGCSIGDSVVMAALSGLYAFWYHLESKKEPKANKELWDRVVQLEDQQRVTKEKVNAINLGQSLKR